MVGGGLVVDKKNKKYKRNIMLVTFDVRPPFVFNEYLREATPNHYTHQQQVAR